tara:strand:+ start:3003 stop:4505 length:1503 start_codon:yes stop_codon:yes gene_type:complete
MGTLTSGAVKDRYTKLVWYNASNNKLYKTTEDGTDADTELSAIANNLTLSGSITGVSSIATTQITIGGGYGDTGCTIGATGAISADGALTVGTIAEVGSDTDKILMSDSGVVKYVTGANLRTYIGAGTSSVANLNDLGDVSYSSGNLNITSLDTIECGAIAIDSSAGITLDSGIGRVIFQNSGDTDDYMRIEVAANGETSIRTYDSDGSAGNLNLVPDGKIKLKGIDGVADCVQVTNGVNVFAAFEASDGDYSNLKIYEQGGSSTDDYLKIMVNENGESTLETIDNAAAAAHLNVQVDGDLILKPGTGGTFIKESGTKSSNRTGYGQLWVKNDTPNDLYWSNDAGGDVRLTNGASVAESTTVRHILSGGFNYSYTAGTKVYLPINGSISELSYGGTTEYNTFIVPYNGYVNQVICRSEEACGSTVVGFHLSGNGTEFPNSTAQASVTVDMAVDDTAYKFDFTSSNTFAAGNAINFSFDPTNDANDTIFMVELIFDTSVGL